MRSSCADLQSENFPRKNEHQSELRNSTWKDLTVTGPKSGKAAACSAATCAAHRPTTESVPMGTRGTKRRGEETPGSTLEVTQGGVRGDEQGEMGADIGVKEEGDGGVSAYAVCH